ncbi:MAG: ASCH domain-containing protein [Clostridia bacterium]|nr:ASCH domain-containing protein [Clostridia bacterium]
MKVLSLTEPYATLIRIGIKKVETRSWKTNYRGKLYIHASSTKISKEDRNNAALMSLVDTNELNYGNIICSCELVDCVEMTDAFIEEIKRNKNEYISGLYEVGRYAWILKNVEILDQPIKAKGRLGIWSFDEKRH